jgi:hypothetical protein
MDSQALDISDSQSRTEGSAKKRRRFVYECDNGPSQLENLPTTSYSSEGGSPITGSSMSLPFSAGLHN